MVFRDEAVHVFHLLLLLNVPIVDTNSVRRMRRMRTFIHMLIVLLIILPINFDSEQEGVVHETLRAQELRVFLHDVNKTNTFFLFECSQVRVLMLLVEEVRVFQSRRRLRLAFSQPGNQTSFEVEQLVQILSLAKSQHVLHEHHVHRFKRRALDREDTKDAGQHGVRVFLEEIAEVRQQTVEQLQLAVTHCLDDEALIVTEEEETSTLSCTFTGLED